MKMRGKLIWVVCLLFLSGVTAFGAQNPSQIFPSRVEGHSPAIELDTPTKARMMP
jgi:hypothetical protein